MNGACGGDKHPKSKFKYFRIDVPKHPVRLVGETLDASRWAQPTRCRQPPSAAEWIPHHKTEIVGLGIIANDSLQGSRNLVSLALDLPAVRLGSMPSHPCPVSPKGPSLLPHQLSG